MTTVALGLAACWPTGDALLVEADPAGGDLASRFNLSPEPGLTTMAQTTRRTAPIPELVGTLWWQRLPCGVPAVLAPQGTRSGKSLATMARDRRTGLSDRFVVDGVTTVLDTGRWCPPSPVDPLLAAADVVLVVTKGDTDQMHQVEDRLRRIRQLATDVRLVMVGGRDQQTPQEVAQTLEVPLAGFVPWDVRGADVLAGRAAPYQGWGAGGWKRLPLLRACRRIARLLQARPTPAPVVSMEPWRGRSWARATAVS